MKKGDKSKLLGREPNQFYHQDGKVIVYREVEEVVVKDVMKNGKYRRRNFHPGKDDVVLDIGAHIGTFLVDVFDKCKQVICFEPDKENFGILILNKEKNSIQNCVLIPKAVVGSDETTRTLFQGNAPYWYSFFNTHRKKSVVVDCININDVVKEYNPTMIKMNAEGSEFEILLGINDYTNIHKISFELHFAMHKEQKNDFVIQKNIKSYLEGHGFNCESLAKEFGGHWQTVFTVFK